MIEAFNWWPALLVCASLGIGEPAALSAQEATPATPPPEAVQPLQYVGPAFPGDQWAYFSGKKDAPLSQTWSMGVDSETSQPILICKGEPYGYIKTTQTFSDFEMGLEWRYPTDPNGNSGVLLFTSGEDRIWPTSLQVQLHQPEAGSTFPLGGAKTENELRNVPPLSKPVNQWNECRIRCENGRVSVTVNGTRVGEVTGCQPTAGAISLQSEGSEIHFRQIWIQPLDAPQAARADSSRDSYVVVRESSPELGRRAQKKLDKRLGRASAKKNALGLKAVVTGGSWREEVECRVGQAANKDL